MGEERPSKKKRFVDEGKQDRTVDEGKQDGKNMSECCRGERSRTWLMKIGRAHV